MNVVLIDDHLLLQVLLDNEPIDLRTESTVLTTTGLWYHRLCRALATDRVIGSLSRQLAGVDASVARSAIDAITQLPEDIELVSLRTLGWSMAQLAANGHRLNLLSLEALAAAKYLSAEVCLSPASSGTAVHTAAASEALSVRIVG